MPRESRSPVFNLLQPSMFIQNIRDYLNTIQHARGLQK
jgi:hypothetical protein